MTWTDKTWAPGRLLSTDLNTAVRDNFRHIAAAWDSYTPALTAATTNPSLGSTGMATGRYLQVGKTVKWSVLIQAGGTGISAGSGEYLISLPVTPRAVFSAIGHGWIYNTGGWLTFVVDGGSSPARMISSSGLISNTVGGLSGGGQVLTVGGTYEAA